jgi:hypothetical protein
VGKPFDLGIFFEHDRFVVFGEYLKLFSFLHAQIASYFFGNDDSAEFIYASHHTCSLHIHLSFGSGLFKDIVCKMILIILFLVYNVINSAAYSERSAYFFVLLIRAAA